MTWCSLTRTPLLVQAPKQIVELIGARLFLTRREKRAAKRGRDAGLGGREIDPDHTSIHLVGFRLAQERVRVHQGPNGRIARGFPLNPPSGEMVA